MQAGTRVRLIANPGRVGVVTGEPKIRAGRKNIRFSFPMEQIGIVIPSWKWSKKRLLIL